MKFKITKQFVEKPRLVRPFGTSFVQTFLQFKHTLQSVMGYFWLVTCNVNTKKLQQLTDPDPAYATNLTEGIARSA